MIFDCIIYYVCNSFPKAGERKPVKFEISSLHSEGLVTYRPHKCQEVITIHSLTLPTCKNNSTGFLCRQLVMVHIYAFTDLETAVCNGCGSRRSLTVYWYVEQQRTCKEDGWRVMGWTMGSNINNYVFFPNKNVWIFMSHVEREYTSIHLSELSELSQQRWVKKRPGWIKVTIEKTDESSNIRPTMLITTL